MRFVFALFLMTSLAMAAEWNSYANARFGYSVDIPPGFKQFGEKPESADGLTFRSAAGDAELLVWGANIVDGTFKDEMDKRIQWAKDDGWSVKYVSYDKQAVLTWAAFSGVKGKRIFYERALSSCKATQVVMFRIEYPDARKKNYDKIVERIGKSLKAAVEGNCS
jgi:hypothetical protein